MSNRSIIDRLERELDDYRTDVDDSHPTYELGRRLYDYTQALEGVPWSVVLEARELCGEFETVGLCIDEGWETSADGLIVRVKAWLAELRMKYGRSWPGE